MFLCKRPTHTASQNKIGPKKAEIRNRVEKTALFLLRRNFVSQGKAIDLKGLGYPLKKVAQGQYSGNRLSFLISGILSRILPINQSSYHKKLLVITKK